MRLRSEPGRPHRGHELVHGDRALVAWNVLPCVREVAGLRLPCIEHGLVDRDAHPRELLRDDHGALTFSIARRGWPSRPPPSLQEKQNTRPSELPSSFPGN